MDKETKKELETIKNMLVRIIQYNIHDYYGEMDNEEVIKHFIPKVK